MGKKNQKHWEMGKALEKIFPGCVVDNTGTCIDEKGDEWTHLSIKRTIWINKRTGELSEVCPD